MNGRENEREPGTCLPAAFNLLIIEDELLIAVSIEQVALEMGASEVAILRRQEALRFVPGSAFEADIAVVDKRTANQHLHAVVDLVVNTGALLVVTITDEETAGDGLLESAAALLHKPFGDDDIRRALTTALQRMRSSSPARRPVHFDPPAFSLRSSSSSSAVNRSGTASLAVSS